MRPVFNVLGRALRRAGNVLSAAPQCAVEFLTQFKTALSKCCTAQTVLQSAVRKDVPTQWNGGCDSTTALLLLKDKYLQVHTHIRTHIGERKERGSKCCTCCASASEVGA